METLYGTTNLICCNLTSGFITKSHTTQWAKSRGWGVIYKGDTHILKKIFKIFNLLTLHHISPKFLILYTDLGGES